MLNSASLEPSSLVTGSSRLGNTVALSQDLTQFLNIPDPTEAERAEWSFVLTSTLLEVEDEVEATPEKKKKKKKDKTAEMEVEPAEVKVEVKVSTNLCVFAHKGTNK